MPTRWSKKNQKQAHVIQLHVTFTWNVVGSFWDILRPPIHHHECHICAFPLQSEVYSITFGWHGCVDPNCGWYKHLQKQWFLAVFGVRNPGPGSLIWIDNLYFMMFQVQELPGGPFFGPQLTQSQCEPGMCGYYTMHHYAKFNTKTIL